MGDVGQTLRFPGFVGGSYQMRSIITDCQRCVNMYADLDEMGTAKEGSVGVLMGTPGISVLTSLPQSPVRGTYTAAGNGRVFAVAGNGFYEITNNSGWSYTLLGSLVTNTGNVSMSDNGTSVFVVDGANGYFYNFSQKNLQSLYLFTVGSSVNAVLGSQYSNNANTFTIVESSTPVYNFTVLSSSVTVGAVYQDPNTMNQFTATQTTSSSTSLLAFGNSAPTINYNFAVTSANATVGAIYADASNNYFTVTTTISGGAVLSTYGISPPISAGAITLIKTSGTGDATISVTSSTNVGGSLVLVTGTPTSGDVNNTPLFVSSVVKTSTIVCAANGAPTNGATTLTLLSGAGDPTISIAASYSVSAVPWLPLTTYSLNQTIVPIARGYQYICTQGGISGSTIPIFPTTAGATVSDGTAIWQCVSTFTKVTDPGFLGSNIIAYQDGYFFFAKPNSNQVYCSNNNDVTFNALNFLSLGGSPANVLNMVSLHRNLYIQTTKTTEVYYDAGVSPGFPFSRINGGYLEQGLAAQFSLAQTANAMFWLGQDKSGNGIVYTTSTFLPDRISTFAVEEQINQYSTIADAIGYTYQEAGHQFYVLNFPTAQATWCFDISTGLWHERSYNNNGQPQMQLGVFHTYGMGIHIVGDYSSGNIYQMAQNIYSDNGTPILRKRVAPHLATDMKRIFYSKLQIDIQQGVGLDGGVQGSDPTVMLRFSDTGGRTWSNIQTASFGEIGKYKTRAMFRRLGSARDRVFEVTISDPVFVAIVGAELRFEVGDH